MNLSKDQWILVTRSKAEGLSSASRLFWLSTPQTNLAGRACLICLPQRAESERESIQGIRDRENQSRYDLFTNRRKKRGKELTLCSKHTGKVCEEVKTTARVLQQEDTDCDPKNDASLPPSFRISRPKKAKQSAEMAPDLSLHYWWLSMPLDRDVTLLWLLKRA